MTRPLTEAAFQQRITDYCDWLKLTWHHETDSRRSRAGFPDLVITGPGGASSSPNSRPPPADSAPTNAAGSSPSPSPTPRSTSGRPDDWPTIQTRLKELTQPCPD